MSSPRGLRRFGSWLRSFGSGAPTIAANTTHTADAASDRNSDANAADVRLGLRSTLTAFQAANSKAKATERAVAHAMRKDKKRLDFESRRTAQLQLATSTGWFKEIAIFGITASRMGVLVVWVPQLFAWIGTIAMIVNDPYVIYNSVLRAANIDPTKLDLSRDLANSSVLIAVASGTGTATMILIAVTAGSHALSTLLSRHRLAAESDKYPVAAINRKQMPAWLATVIAVLSCAVLSFFTLYLHNVAEANYVNSTASAMSGSTVIGRSIVLYVTALPWFLLVCETISRILPFAHLRKVSVRRARAAAHQRWDIWRDRSMLASVRRAARRARLACNHMLDVLRMVAAYTDYEATDSDLAGQVEMSDIATIFSKAAEVEETRSSPLLPINMSGKVPSLYLPGLPVVSPTLADAINQYQTLWYEILPKLSDKMPPLQETYGTLRKSADKAAKKWLGLTFDREEDSEASENPSAAENADDAGDGSPEGGDKIPAPVPLSVVS